MQLKIFQQLNNLIFNRSADSDLARVNFESWIIKTINELNETHFFVWKSIWQHNMFNYRYKESWLTWFRDKLRIVKNLILKILTIQHYTINQCQK
jgi:hypothetical protein